MNSELSSIHTSKVTEGTKKAYRLIRKITKWPNSNKLQVKEFIQKLILDAKNLRVPKMPLLW